MKRTKKTKLRPGVCRFCQAKTEQPNFFRCEKHWNEGAQEQRTTPEALMQLAEHIAQHAVLISLPADRELLAKTARRLQRCKDVVAALPTSGTIH
jgi:hypothetical protein